MEDDLSQKDADVNSPTLARNQHESKISQTLKNIDNLKTLKSIETMEVQLCVENLNSTSKELNKWETLMVSIPEREEDNKMVILNMRGKKHKIRAVHFRDHPESRLGSLVKATDVEEILELCDHFCPGPVPEYYFDRFLTSSCLKTNILFSIAQS